MHPFSWNMPKSGRIARNDTLGQLGRYEHFRWHHSRCRLYPYRAMVGRRCIGLRNSETVWCSPTIWTVIMPFTQPAVGFAGSVSQPGTIIAVTGEDRKSTRLNSSHQIISYAVFCLKKKKNNQIR